MDQREDKYAVDRNNKMVNFPAQEQIMAKKLAEIQAETAAVYKPTIKDQFENKLKQHQVDIEKLNSLLSLYDASPEVREFARLLEIRLG